MTEGGAKEIERRERERERESGGENDKVFGIEVGTPPFHYDLMACR